MSKMSEFDLYIGELRNAVQALTAVADGLVALFTASSETETETPSSPKVEPPKPKPITLEQVRAVLAEKSRSGHTAEVRELLQRHGAGRLSEIDPTGYPTLLLEATAVGLATEEGAHG
jgi:hypothetical protein